VIKGALGFSRESLGYNAKFVYPREGGISALPRALAAALKTPPKYNLTVEKVELRTRTATLSNGQQVRYERLLNTAPLPHFLAAITDVPPEIVAATRQLRATTVHYFDIGVRGPGSEASQYHWSIFRSRSISFIARVRIPRYMRTPRRKGAAAIMSRCPAAQRNC